jgi:tetratricopeptide (TPR) repeat protein
MKGDDAATDEYERIIADIRSQLDGDPVHDSSLLFQLGEQYRQHPLAREIIREIGRMHFAVASAETREELEARIADLHGSFETGLAAAMGLMLVGDAEGTRRVLEEIIEYFDRNQDSCGDDAFTEYRVFENPYQAGLYTELFGTSKVVRRPPYNFAALYLQYGTVLVELGEFNAAETALHRSRQFNPIGTWALFELGEVLKHGKRLDEFHQLSTFALSLVFDAQQAARAYRNLGWFYTEQGSYEVAVACYRQSSLLDVSSVPRCANELAYIEQITGQPTAMPYEGIHQALQVYGIPIALSDAVQSVLARVDGEPGIRDDIVETVKAAMAASDFRGGSPDEFAVFLFSCAGRYREHPYTPGILRWIGWILAENQTPDVRAKLCLAITRVADSYGVGHPRLGFMDELDLLATHPEQEGAVTVTATSTGKVLAAFNFEDGRISTNRELKLDPEVVQPEFIFDAYQLLEAYVDGQLSVQR